MFGVNSTNKQMPNKFLTKEDVVATATAQGLEPALLQAVADVESAGRGFLGSGRLKVLFEGHVFYQELLHVGIDPVPLTVKYPMLVYKNWTNLYYMGGEREWLRVNQAKTIHAEAAYRSTSWGMFQLMGFNSLKAGYDTVFSMVVSFEMGEFFQLQSIVRWLDATSLLAILKAKDWPRFAHGYNGPGYKTNRYDERLNNAYIMRVAQGWNNGTGGAA